MKKSTLIMISVAVALLILASGSVYAQIQSRSIKAEIPFDFTIGDKLHPAGNYTATPLANSSILRVRATENAEATAVGTIAVEAANNNEVKPMFVFRRYGNQYFLAEVWMGLGNKTGCELPKLAKERQVAKAQPKPELIMVAAK